MQDWIHRYNEFFILVLTFLGCIAAWLALRKRQSSSPSLDRSTAVNASESQVAVTQPSKSPVTDAAVATGSGNTQHVNSHNVSYTLPVVPFGAPGRERYDEWRELTNELHGAFEQIGYGFIPLNVLRPGDERNDYEAGIRRGYQVIRNRLFISDALRREKVLEKYEELCRYAVSARSPRLREQRDCPTMKAFDEKVSIFEDELMEIARTDLRQSPSARANREDQQPSVHPAPNFVYAGGKLKPVFISPHAEEGFCDPRTEQQREKAVHMFVLKFENRKPENQKIRRALNVIAKMKFHHKNGATARDIDYGVWLNSSCNSTSFGVGDTRELAMLCKLEGPQTTFEDRRVNNPNFDKGFSYFDWPEVEGYDKVDITLIDQNSQTTFNVTLKFWNQGASVCTTEA